MLHYIYLLLLEDSNIVGNSVYKVGKSFIENDNDEIIPEIPNYETQIILINLCKNAYYVEEQILKFFNYEFELAFESGYFIGDVKKMKQIINEIIDEEESESGSDNDIEENYVNVIDFAIEIDANLNGTNYINGINGINEVIHSDTSNNTSNASSLIIGRAEFIDTE